MRALRTKSFIYINNLYNISAISLIFDLKVRLESVHQDLNLRFWRYPPKGVLNRRTKNRFFLIYEQFHDFFFVKFFCKKTFDNTGYGRFYNLVANFHLLLHV